MKHLKLAMICLGFALTVMVVTEAEAGRIKKPPKGSRTEKSEEMQVPQSYEKYPPMHFVTGVLSRDPHSGWMIGDTPLLVHKNCTIYLEGAEEGWLEEGREAIVMGSWLENSISAVSIRMTNPDFNPNKRDALEGLMEPGEDPNCGRFTERVD